MKRLVDWLIALAQRTPYFHLFHADGSLYMARYWLMPMWLLRECSERDRDAHEVSYLKTKKWLPLALRLHHIATADHDRELHDHPASFISIVLRGGYVERRPLDPIELKFTPDREEEGYLSVRMPGSIAFRRYTDRHRIVSVLPETWTLVVWFRKRQFWGFYTERGKIHWQHYDSVHNTRAL